MKYLCKVYKVIGMQEIEVEGTNLEDTAKQKACYQAMQNHEKRGFEAWMKSDRGYIVITEKR
jgi:hypothetical protein